MASAVILGMIVTMFPEPAEQTKAIGVFSFVASAGASIGLLAGGVITQAINGTGSSLSICRSASRRVCWRSDLFAAMSGSASGAVPTFSAPRS